MKKYTVIRYVPYAFVLYHVDAHSPESALDTAHLLYEEYGKKPLDRRDTLALNWLVISGHHQEIDLERKI